MTVYVTPGKPEFVEPAATLNRKIEWELESYERSLQQLIRRAESTLKNVQLAQANEPSLVWNGDSGFSNDMQKIEQHASRIRTLSEMASIISSGR